MQVTCVDGRSLLLFSIEGFKMTEDTPYKIVGGASDSTSGNDGDTRSVPVPRYAVVSASEAYRMFQMR